MRFLPPFFPIVNPIFNTVKYNPDSNDTINGPIVQFGMNAAFACHVQKEAEAAGSNPARSTNY